MQGYDLSSHESVPISWTSAAQHTFKGSAGIRLAQGQFAASILIAIV